MITFQVDGVKGKERARHGKNGVYTPSSTKQYENMILTKYKLAGGTLHNLPQALKITIECYYTMPKNTSQKNKARALQNDIKHVKHKTDVDNVAKAVLDGLNKVAYYDDCQVCELVVSKRYGITEKIVVTVELVGEGM